jgi:hypothetical protein
MKNKLLLLLGVMALTALSFQTFTAAKPEYAQPEYAKPEEPWRPDQLLAPADLAKTIGDAGARQPLIISIGPGAIIKGSIDIGPGRDTANIAKLRQRLSELPKDANIVINCGC